MSKVKKVLKIVGLVLLALVLVVGGYVGFQVRQFNASMDKVYDVPVPTVARSTDPAVIERGRHLARSLAACATQDCHGGDMGGGRTLDMGPLGRLSGPNVTLIAQAYSDGELARLIRHGLRRDGRSLRFMPAKEIGWIPDSDILAVVSWIRTLPVVNRPSGPIEVGVLGKVLDRRGAFEMDVARGIDHAAHEAVPEPAPIAAYGRFIARACTGCHGAHFSGGPIPGAPPSMPVPLNITPHATGIASWTYEDFERMSRDGMRKNGQRLNPFMPIEILTNMDDTERRALWAYLRELPALPSGGR